MERSVPPAPYRESKINRSDYVDGLESSAIDVIETNLDDIEISDNQWSILSRFSQDRKYRFDGLNGEDSLSIILEDVQKFTNDKNKELGDDQKISIISEDETEALRYVVSRDPEKYRAKNVQPSDFMEMLRDDFESLKMIEDGSEKNNKESTPSSKNKPKKNPNESKDKNKTGKSKKLTDIDFDKEFENISYKASTEERRHERVEDDKKREELDTLYSKVKDTRENYAKKAWKKSNMSDYTGMYSSARKAYSAAVKKYIQTSWKYSADQGIDLENFESEEDAKRHAVYTMMADEVNHLAAAEYKVFSNSKNVKFMEWWQKRSKYTRIGVGVAVGFSSALIVGSTFGAGAAIGAGVATKFTRGYVNSKKYVGSSPDRMANETFSAWEKKKNLHIDDIFIGSDNRIGEQRKANYKAIAFGGGSVAVGAVLGHAFSEFNDSAQEWYDSQPNTMENIPLEYDSQSLEDQLAADFPQHTEVDQINSSTDAVTEVSENPPVEIENDTGVETTGDYYESLDVVFDASVEQEIANNVTDSANPITNARFIAVHSDGLSSNQLLDMTFDKFTADYGVEAYSQGDRIFIDGVALGGNETVFSDASGNIISNPTKSLNEIMMQIALKNIG